jgi:Mn2+/Fe2+ NRAMP family transporter
MPEKTVPETTDSLNTAPSRRSIFRSVGPALIVACVVLGPGSILTSSKVGCQFGYQMVWVLGAAGLLMLAAVATAARVGVVFEGSPCTELARRLGRPVAVLAGVCVFAIAACFQFSNNLGVLMSMEPLISTDAHWQPVVLVGLNLAIIACLFGFRRLYRPIEKLMAWLVGLMLLGFAANLLLARPSLLGLLHGLVPGIPDELAGSFLPRLETAATGPGVMAAVPRVVDPWLSLQGLVATTFSIAGAFYQAYLVKEKGWSTGQLKQGLVDSLVGMSVLVGISLMIMVTSAAVLLGNVAPTDLRSAADVARQLEPLFGSAAKWLFCVGIFAGAFSSFLVNSLVGGTLLADGLGYEARLDSQATKIFTVAVLLIGMAVALATDAQGRVPLIIFAQAATVLGGPVLALSLFYLAWRAGAEGLAKTPGWMLTLTGAGAVVVIALAIRTAWRIYLTIGL